MAYDRTDWHSGGEYPADLPEENGGTHIGMYLAWAFSRDMASADHRKESRDLLKQLERREITGRDFFTKACDEKFWEEDLNDDGNAFAIDYYEQDSPFAKQFACYLQDYCDVFNAYAASQGFEYESTYHVENTWDNFDRLKPILDQRLATWRVWREDPANHAQDPKTQFLNTCNEIGQLLAAQGFKSSKKGASWKKTAADKDTVFEVSFEPDRYNSRNEVKLSVYIRVSSKALKKWLTSKFGKESVSDHILLGSLRRPIKKSQTRTWQVAGIEARQSHHEIRESIEQHALPLFELLADRPRALEYFATHGSEFLGICEPEATPLAFMLYFGTQQQAQRFFEVFLAGCHSAYRATAINGFKNLPKSTDEIQWNCSNYWGEQYIKLAYAEGLTLPSKA